MKKLNKKGFTLTELIVVIAVIAILAAVLIPTLTGYIEKARISADNQEVAVLNKLLLGAQIDEVEFKDVNDLKKYLAEEMEYDGDYSLGVKDSYLWFDTESYEFVIKSKSDVEKLELATKEYKRATTLKSPEGLLVTGEYEVWLVGGNGEWVKAVEAIRNLGENETVQKALVSLTEALEDLGLSSQSSQLLSNLAFAGSNGNLYEYKDNSFNKVIGETTKSIIQSNVIINSLNKQQIFHNEHVIKVIDSINNNDDYINLSNFTVSEQNNDGSYDIIVNIQKVEQNTADELDLIFSMLRGIISYFYVVNSDNSSSLDITITPNINDENIAPENVSEYTLSLAKILDSNLLNNDSSEVAQKLTNNITNGITLDEEFTTQVYELSATVLVAALMNKPCDSTKGYNLSLIANSSTTEYNVSNEVIVTAKFGETTVVYNFTFVDASK